MNRLYTLHPDNMCIEENESYYAYMSSKGYFLENRGVFFCRFRKAEPEQLDYYAVVQPSGNGTAENEFAAFFREHGWQYVSCINNVYIFSSFRGNKIPALPDEFLHRQRKLLRRLKKQQIISVVLWMIILAVFLFLIFFPDTAVKITGFAEMYKKLIESAESFVVLGACLLYGIIADLRRVFFINKEYRKTEGDCQETDTVNAYKKFRVQKLLSVLFFICVCVIFVTGKLSVTKYPMPETIEYPYVQIAEFDDAGQRVKNPLNDENSSVTEKNSLLCRAFHTKEFVESTGQDWSWLYQDVYLLKNENYSDALVKALMKDAVFAESEESFISVDVPGLDSAYITNGLECIAVKGKMIAVFEYDFSDSNEMMALLEVLAEKWSDN